MRRPPYIVGVFLIACVASAGADGGCPASPVVQPSAPVNAPSEALTKPRQGDHVRLVCRLQDAAVRLDGKLNEAVWQVLPKNSDFRVIDPDTLAPAALATEVRMFYTSRGFYLGVEMAQPPETLVEYLSGRDQWLNRDFFSFTLDTSGEGRYGFWFTLALGDSKSDGTILPERQHSDSWDGAWRGATARTQAGWSAEYFIPWASVNMPRVEGARTMGIFVQRNVAYLDERHAWPPLPWTKPKFLSAFAPIELRDVSPRQQYSFTPYIATIHHFAGGVEEPPKAGVDLFWRPLSNIQLAATLHPDFGNVEADDVVINLSNYETFFPEKRLFFQEGQEIFTVGNGGRGGTALLHTRRIGSPPVPPKVPSGVRVENADLARPASLRGAFKATGQNGPLRYGLLGVSEEDASFNAWAGDEHLILRQEGRDFAAARLLYERTTVSYRSLGILATAMRHPERIARVTAIDGQYHTAGGRLRLNSRFIASNITGRAEDGQGGSLEASYQPRQGISHRISLAVFDDSIELNDMGFQFRNDFRRAGYRLRVSNSNGNRFRNTRTSVRFDRMWNTAGKLIDAQVSVNQTLTLHNFSELRAQLGFKPARHDDRGSFGNGIFRVAGAWNAELRYSSNSAQRLAYSIRQRWQQESLRGLQRRAAGNVRWRPTDRMTLAFALRYVNRDAWLLHQSHGAFAAFAAEQWGSNLDLSYFLSARQQVTVGFQWVGVQAIAREFYRIANSTSRLERAEDTSPISRDFNISRMHLQLRYHWQIAPLSDVFVVYARAAELPKAQSRLLGFRELVTETVNERVGEYLAVKLRYRFGS